MKKLALSLVILAFFATSTYAAPAHKTTPQQNRMKMCAQQYHQKKIAKSQYRAFMSQCLRTHKTDITTKK